MTILRIAFILPALADFLLAGLTLTRAIGVEDDSIVPRLQFSGGAFAWGIMLLFALARPVDRAWVLIPTAIVVACVVIAVGVGYLMGVVGGVSAASAVFMGAAIFSFGFLGLRFANLRASQDQSTGAP